MFPYKTTDYIEYSRMSGIQGIVVYANSFFKSSFDKTKTKSETYKIIPCVESKTTICITKLSILLLF